MSRFYESKKWIFDGKGSKTVEAQTLARPRQGKESPIRD